MIWYICLFTYIWIAKIVPDVLVFLKIEGHFAAKGPSGWKIQVSPGSCVCNVMIIESLLTLPSRSTTMPGIILCMCPANERRRYNVTSSLIGWAHTQNDPWMPLTHLWHSRNGQHIAENIFQYIYMKEKIFYLSMTFTEFWDSQGNSKI